MEHVRGRRQLTWRAGGAAVAIGMACVAAGAAGPAQAAVAGGRGTGPVIVPIANQKVIASWAPTATASSATERPAPTSRTPAG